MPDGICAHGDCLVDEPIKLVERRVKGSDHTEVYCDRHDPLEDPRVADHFEAVAQMLVHVFNCPECKDIWTLPEEFLDGEPRDDCKRCDGPLEHGETEVTHA